MNEPKWQRLASHHGASTILLRKDEELVARTRQVRRDLSFWRLFTNPGEAFTIKQ